MAKKLKNKTSKKAVKSVHKAKKHITKPLNAKSLKANKSVKKELKGRNRSKTYFQQKGRSSMKTKKVGGSHGKITPQTQIRGNFYIKVENVVAFASLGVDIPLQRLVAEVENTEYEPEQFPGLVYRQQDPRAAALIFSSGKIVCTGAKSIENAKIAMNKVADRIRLLGIKTPKVFPIEIENIVASSKIDAKLNLEEIAFMLENAEYEPEQFPGLVFRITEPRVAFLLFSSGKIICTGAHSLEDVSRALDKFKVKLEEIGLEVTPSKEEPPKVTTTKT